MFKFTLIRDLFTVPEKADAETFYREVDAACGTPYLGTTVRALAERIVYLEQRIIKLEKRDDA